MAVDELAYHDPTKRLYLDLFTEIAILEHLVRLRFEPKQMADLSAADFGVLNHFTRLDKTQEKLDSLAWCFQVTVPEMRNTISGLAGRRFVQLDWVDGQETVFIAEFGRKIHSEIIADMAPDVVEIMSEFAPSDIEVTVRTLREMRRTFDNLPDR